MKLTTVRTIRNMALVTEIFGLFANIPQAFWIGLMVYLTTFLYTIQQLENKHLAESEPEPTDEEKDDENESR